MRVNVDTKKPSEVAADLLVIPIAELKAKGWQPSARIAAIDDALSGQLSAVVKSGDFRGKANQSAVLYTNGAIRAKRILLTGLGRFADINAETLRNVAGKAINSACAKGARKVTLCLEPSADLDVIAGAQAASEGAILANYRFDTYRAKKSDAPADVASLSLLIETSSQLRDARAAAKTGSILADSQNLARQLSNEPGNALPPLELARAAVRVGREVGLSVRVMKEPELKRRAMGAILAVGAGSSRPPCMIVMEHDPRSRKAQTGKGASKATKRKGARRQPTICLVGKGITFDSGGISIKPAASMDEMKHDMSGAAAVIGSMRAIALLKLPIRVVGVIAAAENLPSSTAYRPGDIVTAMSKKTIEILNTDAEGRVVLADALHFARTEFEPDAMVDLATLTGAVVVALGRWATGLFGNHDKLIEGLREAGETSGERAWPMPLWDVHRRAVRSEVADIKNTTGRDGSSSTAAAFLENFVGDTPWVHMDIAGTGWGSSRASYQRKGATGVGVRMLLELLRNWKERRIV
ncbi:MAG: leucyl aminopeptidase [Myxococcota bacterium]